MGKGPKTKLDIICPRCGREATPVRGYCKNCATTLVRMGKLKKLLVDDMPKQLTKYQEEVLNGLMLGDGCIYRHTDTCKPHLTVVRSQVDRDYLTDNYNVFKDFCKEGRGVIDGSVFDKRTGNTNFFSKFVTRRCEALIPYYKRWYPNREKHVPQDIILTPLTLAIWFSDDGSIRNSCSEWRFQLQLSTDSFSKQEVDILKRKIEIICNEKFYIVGDADKKNLRIGAADSGTRAFIKIIDNYLPKSMNRKAIWKTKEARFYSNQPVSKSKMENGEGRSLEKEKIKKLISQNKSISEISKIFGIGKSGMRKRISKYGIKTFKGF